jgi:hypothetical protein
MSTYSTPLKAAEAILFANQLLRMVDTLVEKLGPKRAT